jgi:hypothetical protein
MDFSRRTDFQASPFHQNFFPKVDFLVNGFFKETVLPCRNVNDINNINTEAITRVKPAVLRQVSEEAEH